MAALAYDKLEVPLAALGLMGQAKPFSGQSSLGRSHSEQLHEPRSTAQQLQCAGCTTGDPNDHAAGAWARVLSAEAWTSVGVHEDAYEADSVPVYVMLPLDTVSGLPETLACRQQRWDAHDYAAGPGDGGGG
jgi:hypothetical protein